MFKIKDDVHFNTNQIQILTSDLFKRWQCQFNRKYHIFF